MNEVIKHTGSLLEYSRCFRYSLVRLRFTPRIEVIIRFINVEHLVADSWTVSAASRQATAGELGLPSRSNGCLCSQVYFMPQSSKSVYKHSEKEQIAPFSLPVPFPCVNMLSPSNTSEEGTQTFPHPSTEEHTCVSSPMCFQQTRKSFPCSSVKFASLFYFIFFCIYLFCVCVFVNMYTILLIQTSEDNFQKSVLSLLCESQKSNSVSGWAVSVLLAQLSDQLPHFKVLLLGQ